MTAAIILGAALCLLEPGFAFSLRRLECQVPLEPLFFAWLPLSVAMVMTALVIAVHYVVQTICHEDRLPQNDKFQSRSER